MKWRKGWNGDSRLQVKALKNVYYRETAIVLDQQIIQSFAAMTLTIKFRFSLQLAVVTIFLNECEGDGKVCWETLKPYELSSITGRRCYNYEDYCFFPIDCRLLEKN